MPGLGGYRGAGTGKFEYYRSLGSVDGTLALFGGWTGIKLDTYGDDEELRHVESKQCNWVGFHSIKPETC